MKTTNFKTISIKNNNLVLLDQTKLPLKEEYIVTDNYERISEAIEKLEVRGAPAIGVTAAYALALSFRGFTGETSSHFEKVYNRLASTRPTAVNLFWALNKMKDEFESLKENDDIFEILLHKAKGIHQDDVMKCAAMGRHGLKIFDKPSRVLTHCNTGQLATGGEGTAFAVILHAFRKGFVSFVHADETRPLLQGSRLTAFELEKAGIPFAINTDSTAAYLMQNGKVDLVITGADRIAANGDSANKIGTYNLAVLCDYHNIPFYIAAPTSTIDKGCDSGDKIKIEERSPDEVLFFGDAQVSKKEYSVVSPAFDVTSAKLINGIITEEGLFGPPYNFNG